MFCPRFSEETQEAWQERKLACREFAREKGYSLIVEFEAVEHLQMRYMKQDFTRLLVARSGYYDLGFLLWSRRNRIPMVDVYLPPPPEPPHRQVMALPVRETQAEWRRKHVSRRSKREETYSSRFAS
jgi:hypothetical protein